VALGSACRAPPRLSAASLDPACRLICLALLSSASLFASFPFAAIVAFSAFFFLRLEGISLSNILRESAFILVFALITAALRVFGGNREPVAPYAVAADSALYGLKLLSAFLVGRLFYASTTLSELRDAATRIARRIPFLRRFDVGLSLSLVLCYIPLIFDEWRDSLEAARSRGMPRRPDIEQQSRFLTAFLRRLMLRATALPQALVARGWSKDRGIAPSHWKARDSVAALICCLAFAGASLHLV
jgi:energy-coupling factor transporter transmembrane protein EcfT